MKNLTSYAFLILASLIYSLGHPNLLGILIPFGPIIGTSFLLFYIFSAKTVKKAISYYLTFNLPITIFSFYWITNTLQEFGDLPFPVAAFLNLLFTLIFSPHYWVLIISIFIIKKYKSHLFGQIYNTALASFCVAVVMTIIEYYTPQQFPIMLGQPWIVLSEFLGLAPIFGLPIFSFFSYLICMELIRFFKFKRFAISNWSFIFIFIVANIFIANTPKKNLAPPQKLNIRLVQANISNFLKTESEGGGYASSKFVLNAYRELSLKPFINNKKIDLIIWPETAYPFPINSNKEDLKETLLPPIITEIIQYKMSAMLIGGYDHNKDNPTNPYFMTEFNAAFLIDSYGKLKDVFHKHMLIPFGETLPVGPFKELVSRYLPAVAFFAEGSKFPLFELESKVKFFTTICYELLKPEFIREYLNSLKERPQFMVNLTNDSWYGNTVEPEQHLFLARWRAIEFNLPIIRSTNTGISSYIDAQGREIRRLQYDVKANLDFILPIEPSTGPTLYQQFGFLTILPLWLIYFIFSIFLLKSKYAKNHNRS